MGGETGGRRVVNMYCWEQGKNKTSCTLLNE